MKNEIEINKKEISILLKILDIFDVESCSILNDEYSATGPVLKIKINFPVDIDNINYKGDLVVTLPVW